MRWTLASVMIVGGAAVALTRAAEKPEAPQEVVFKFPARVGKVSRSRIVIKNVGSMEMPGPIPDQKFSQTIEQTVAGKCTKTNQDGSAVHEITIERMATDMSFGGMKMAFDSATFDADQESNPFGRIMGRVMSGLTGAKMTMTLGPDGRPTRIEGLGEVMDKMIDSVAKEASFGPAKGAMDQMRGMFNDDVMSQNIEAMYRLVAPNNRAKIGDKWTHTWDMEFPMFKARLEGSGEYELLGIETFRGRQCAKIRSSESYAMKRRPEAEQNADDGDAKSSPSIFDRMEFEMSSSGGMGTAYWDYENGEMVQFRATDNMTIRVSFKASPAGEDNPAIPGIGVMTQKLRNSVTMELIEEGEPLPGAEPAPAKAE